MHKDHRSIVSDDRPICPLPLVGRCILERCNFWDEVRQECTGECFGDYEPLEEQGWQPSAGPCIIHWTEDDD